MSNITLGPSKETWDMILKQNMVVRNWTMQTREKLRNSASRFGKGKSDTRINPGRKKNGPLRKLYPGIKDWKEEKLQPSLRHNLKKNYGILDTIGFKIQRHGVFVHKGVGRGYQVRGGMVVRVDGSGTGRKRLSRQPISAPIRRTPADWFNPIIDANIDTLANDIANINADAAVNAIRMKIN